MPFIESDLIKFITLVIPGILGVWVYKPFLYRDHIPEHWEYELMQALILGISGFIMAGVFFQYGWVENMFGSFFISCATSIMLGIIFGYLGRKGIFISYLPASVHSNHSPYPEDKPHGRAVEHLYQESLLKEEGERVQIAMFYQIGRREEGEIGLIAYKADRYNEIGLDCYPHLPKDFFETNKEHITIWSKIVNLDSGYVTEIASVEKAWFDKIRQHEFESY